MVLDFPSDFASEVVDGDLSASIAFFRDAEG